ncbi:hypothetical protein ACJX0J_034918, partial [Zea mays]
FTCNFTRFHHPLEDYFDDHQCYILSLCGRMMHCNFTKNPEINIKKVREHCADLRIEGDLLDDYKDNMDALCCIICIKTFNNIDTIIQEESQSYQPNIIKKKGQQYASFETKLMSGNDYNI